MATHHAAWSESVLNPAKKKPREYRLSTQKPYEVLELPQLHERRKACKSAGIPAEWRRISRPSTEVPESFSPECK